MNILTDEQVKHAEAVDQLIRATGYEIGYHEDADTGEREVVLRIGLPLEGQRHAPRIAGYVVPIHVNDAELMGRLLIAHADAINGREPRNWE